MAVTDPPGADAPVIMQLVYWGGLGLGALILGALGYKQKNNKPPSEIASVAGALIDNRAVEPLINELKGLREDLRSTKEELAGLRGVFAHEAEMRKREAEHLKIATDVEFRNRMAQALERLEKAKEGPS